MTSHEYAEKLEVLATFLRFVYEWPFLVNNEIKDESLG